MKKAVLTMIMILTVIVTASAFVSCNVPGANDSQRDESRSSLNTGESDNPNKNESSSESRSTGENESSNDGEASCRHTNVTYVEQVAHKMNADGTFEKGIYLMLCPDCGLSKTVSEVKHNFMEISSAPTCMSDGYVWSECKVCGYQTNKKKTADSRDHFFEVWKVKRTPTYNDSGLVSAKCKFCKTEIDKIIPPCKDKAYTVSNITPKGASCGKEKTGTFTIEIESQELVIENVTIPATNHTLNGQYIDINSNGGVLIFDNIESFNRSGIKLFVEQNLTCKEPVLGSFTCEVCKGILLVNVQLNHVRPANAEPVIKATCENSGKYIFECVVCKKTDAEEIIPALGHVYRYTVSKHNDEYMLLAECKRNCGESEAVKIYAGLKSIVETVSPATCTEVGNIHYDIVDKDGQNVKFDFVIPKQAHTLKKADGTTVFMPAKDDSGVFIRHNYADYKDDITWFADTEFKCTNKNIVGSYVCNVCGESLLLYFYVEHIPAEGEGKIITPATCTTAAVKAAFTCKECGEYIPKTTVGEPLGHDMIFSEAVKNSDGKWVASVSCKRDGCDYADTFVFDEEPVKTTIIPATCTEKGVGQCVGIIGGESFIYTIEIAKSPHTTDSGNRYYPNDVALATDRDIILFADQTPSDGFVSGYFKCASCKNQILVKVKIAD